MLSTSGSLIYQNVLLSDELPNLRGAPPLAVEVSRSAPFILKANDYYVGIGRFAVGLGLLPMLTPLMRDNGGGVCTNGEDISASVTCCYYAAAGAPPSVVGAETFLKLRPVPGVAPTAPLPLPPPPGYNFVYTWDDFLEMLNEAAAAAYASLVAAGAPGWIPAEPPTFAIQGGVLCQCLPSTAMWDWGAGAAYPRLAVAGNSHLYQYVRGLATRIQPKDPEGRSLLLAPQCSALNYRGAPDAAGGRTPSAGPEPFTQASLEKLANNLGPRSLQFRTDLPVVPEVSAGATDRQTVLSDFIISSIDVSDQQGTCVYTGGSGLGTARLVGMVGQAPVQNFRVSLWWTDSHGVTYPVPGGMGASTLKLVFARRELVEHRPVA